MKQMVAPNAPVLARMPFNDIERGFMRNNHGEIFFLWPWGHETLAFPLMKDRTLAKEADLRYIRKPRSIDVDLVNWRDLGIKSVDEFFGLNRDFFGPPRP